MEEGSHLGCSYCGRKHKFKSCHDIEKIQERVASRARERSNRINARSLLRQGEGAWDLGAEHSLEKEEQIEQILDSAMESDSA
jgi:hypothetical protein